MSPKFERGLFRLGMVGCVLVVGVFAYQLLKDPVLPARAQDSASLTSEPPASTTTTTVSATTIPPAPPFGVVSPRDETRVGLPAVLVAGVGTPGAVVTRAEQTTNVDTRGVWAVQVPLTEGVNELEFVETAVDGAEQRLTLTVYYEPNDGGSETSVGAAAGSTPATGSVASASSVPALGLPSAIATAAVADLAYREGVDVATITVVGERDVVWPDSSRGCPQEGVSYVPIAVPGVRLLLELDGERYQYHAGGADPAATFCANPTAPVGG